MNIHKKALHYALGLALSTFGAAQAEVMLSEHSSATLTAMILPDSSEIGSTVNIYMGAKLGSSWYIRGVTTKDWQPLGENIPAAKENVTLTADPLIEQVVDFDITNLLNLGLEVYVAYGKTPADIFKTGHMNKILSKEQSGGFSPDPNANPNTNQTGSNTSSSACDNAAAPEGISYTQNGNVITVTTNGKCIVPPESMCNAPAPTTATNISMLQSFAISDFKMDGITINIPSMPNPLEEAGKALTGSKTCLINVPENYSSFTVNADVCYDITDKVAGSLQSLPSAFVTVTKPITEMFKGTITNTQVNDCFSSGADSITNVVTKEVWIKQADGSYLKK